MSGATPAPRQFLDKPLRLPFTNGGAPTWSSEHRRAAGERLGTQVVIDNRGRRGRAIGAERGKGPGGRTHDPSRSATKMTLRLRSALLPV